MRRERRDQTMEVSVTPTGAPGARIGVLTVLSGLRAGTIHPIGDELTIGRTSESSVAFDDESLSRRHARFMCAHGCYFVEDLKSTNGTFVNGVAVTEPVVLSDGARVQLGRETIVRFTLRDVAEIAEQTRVYEATVRDALTGVFNRHYLDERLESELSFASRHGTSLTVLFVDADHFKAVNDGHGHAAGDEVLRRIAGCLAEEVRTEDVVARFGGEEFVVVLRGIEPRGVLAVAERLRTGIEQLDIAIDGALLRVTVSIGAATHSKDRQFESADALLAVADAALYRAKEAGRNCVFLA